MSFYPLFNINENKGLTRLSNFPPNNWEKVPSGQKKVYAFYTDGQFWYVQHRKDIFENEFESFETSDFTSIKNQVVDGVLIEELVLLEMRFDKIPFQVNELPLVGLPSTHWPEWRATIGFKAENSRVSYQGEIMPTPPKATLLTFHPFIQFEDTSNYFVFVNIEKSHIHRWSEIEIYLSSNGKKNRYKKN